MADGKWITELTALTSLADAARRVLSVRLAVIRDWLPKAMRQSDEDPEYVHQLRVSTRRAGAALDIFSLCLPDKEYKAARKTLRRIRRAAGEARDWDVFLEGLPSREGRGEARQRAVDLLIGYGLSRRMAAQGALTEASPYYPFAFERFLAETVAAVHKAKGDDPPRCLIDLAEPMLSGLLKELHEAASGNLSDYDHLHQVRIIGKRLRYAMEIFVDCFAPAFKDQLYPAVEQMQEILGTANDSHVAGGRLKEVRDRLKVYRIEDAKRFKSGLEHLIQFHEDRLEQQRQTFTDWWAGWQKEGGEGAFWALLKSGETLPPINDGQAPESPPTPPVPQVHHD
jgi:CHAD domain-containing protein